MTAGVGNKLSPYLYNHQDNEEELKNDSDIDENLKYYHQPYRSNTYYPPQISNEEVYYTPLKNLKYEPGESDIDYALRQITTNKKTQGTL